jgi:hypothetical protein
MMYSKIIFLFDTLLMPSLLLSFGWTQDAKAQQGKDSPMEAYYSIVVEKKGVTTHLELNDVPIDWWTNRDLASSTMVTNPWIKPGKNSLRVLK